MGQKHSPPKERAKMLAHVAARLSAARIAASRQPAPFNLALMTDPRATINEGTIAGLPHLPKVTCAVIFRHYESPDRQTLAEKLCRITHEAGHLFIVAGDAALAANIEADGIHLPERRIDEAKKSTCSRPGWIVSAACHGLNSLLKAEQRGIQCAFLSPVFSTTSHPAAKTLGTERLKQLTSNTNMPIIALGGINERNVAQLEGTGISGIAAISALSPD